ncbi:acid phosphatase type 7-like [Ptychodera flava]|uniref:acid phosphatase type 7-like n=1 Tax=Ptychodera flava TaxID=63121 RepID=UPI003969DC34
MPMNLTSNSLNSGLFLLLYLCAFTSPSKGDVIWGKSRPDFTKFDRSPVVGLHLALAGDTEVLASWMNVGRFQQETQPPICAYGKKPDGFTAIASGEAYTYTAGEFDSTLNKVTMNLKEIDFEHGDDVYYRCCNPNLGGWSPLYNFTVRSSGLKSEKTRAPKSHARPGKVQGGKIALVADMGVVFGNRTTESIARHLEKGVQLVVHAGDISYADDFSLFVSNNSFVWTEYMAMVELFAARVPYMVGPGNHEVQYNFTAYRNWFHMPNNASHSESPFYYSFDYMGVHFASLSTEHDFSPGSVQHRWLENDLRKADANRAEVPWILVFGHRPLYCSDWLKWTSRCNVEAKIFRDNIEDLLHKYKVDVYLSGHNHQYERSFAVYNMTVTSRSYRNPPATIYIVNGAAGNPEPNDPTFVNSTMAPWRANKAATVKYGWLLLEANATSLDFTYLFSENDEVFDRFSIIKDAV